MHGYRHTLLLRRSPAALRDDFDRAQAVIGEATGATSLSYRPPYGVFSLAGLRLARDRWQPLLWSHWGRDWEAKATPSSIAARATRMLGPGAVILLHDSDAYSAADSWRQTVAALPAVLEAAAATGRAVRRGEPVDVAADPVAEARLRGPSELRRGPLARRAPEHEVDRPVGPVLDRHVRDELTHRVGDLLHADELVADQVVDTAGAVRMERGDDPVGEVLDVDELAGGAAVAGDRERRPRLRPGDERGDDCGRPGPRPVRDPEAENRRGHPVHRLERAAVHLARELRRGVEVRRQDEGSVLVMRLRAGRVAVHPDRARVDESRDAFGARGLEEVESAVHVDGVGAPGRFDDLVDVCHRGEVQDRLAPAHGLGDGGGVRQVGDCRLEPGPVPGRRRSGRGSEAHGRRRPGCRRRASR